MWQTLATDLWTLKNNQTAFSGDTSGPLEETHKLILLNSALGGGGGCHGDPRLHEKVQPHHLGNRVLVSQAP